MNTIVTAMMVLVRPGPSEAADGDRQQDRRERVQHVHHPHQDRADGAAQDARRDADDSADQRGDEGRDESRQQRQPAAVAGFGPACRGPARRCRGGGRRRRGSAAARSACRAGDRRLVSSGAKTAPSTSSQHDRSRQPRRSCWRRTGSAVSCQKDWALTRWSAAFHSSRRRAASPGRRPSSRSRSPCPAGSEPRPERPAGHATAPLTRGSIAGLQQIDDQVDQHEGQRR